MNPRVVQTAAVLLIGNELLSGKVAEANLFELARTLRALGIALRRVVIVSDDMDEIAREVRELSARHDVVFSSGGVGPTHDDVTLEAVARAFDTPCPVHPTLEGMLRDVYQERLTEGHLRMALVPSGSELVTTREVTWPTVVCRNVWVLPGVPEIFRMKLAVVREYLRGPEPFVSRAVFTKLDEATLKPVLDQVVATHENVEVGSYPKWFDESYKTKVTIDGRTQQCVDAALGQLLALLPPGEPQRTE